MSVDNVVFYRHVKSQLEISNILICMKKINLTFEISEQRKIPTPPNLSEFIIFSPKHELF